MGKHSRIKVSDETEARILGKEDRVVYLEATHKAAEQFGPGSAAYQTITQSINTKNATGAQFF